MNTEMVWNMVSRAAFLTEFMASVCKDVDLCKIVRNACDYKIGQDKWSTRMACTAYNYIYEFDTTLGCYRFRDKKYGPWTRWRAVEGS